MNALEIVKFGSNLLKEKKISSFILDSEILLSKTLNKTRENLLTNLDQKISKKNLSVFKKYLQRRSNNEPMAYILEEKEFWSKKFYINKFLLAVPLIITYLIGPIGLFIYWIIRIFYAKRISLYE